MNIKENSEALIFHLYKLAQIGRFRGLYEVENYIDRFQYRPVQTGLKMIVNGEEPSSVNLFYEELIKEETDESVIKILKAVNTGVSMIAAGSAPGDIYYGLTSLFGESVFNGVCNLFLDYEKEKHAFFPGMVRIADDDKEALMVEKALLYEFARMPGFITGCVSIDTLAGILLSCPVDIQMKVIHYLPVYNGREVMRIYPDAMKSRDKRVASIDVFFKWYMFMTGNGELPSET